MEGRLPEAGEEESNSVGSIIREATLEPTADGAYGMNAGSKGGVKAAHGSDRGSKFLPAFTGVQDQHLGDLDGLEDSLEGDEDSYSGTEEDEEDTTWIQWFTNIKGNEFFCQVDEEYIQDDFNLTGLSSYVPYYEHALDVILDMESPNEELLTEEQQEVVESAAEMLYGLIHARFILTSRGLPAMLDKYRNVHFGRCPHVFCQGQPVLPLGLSDVLGNSMVKIWCPKCQAVYFPKSSRTCSIDGAYFGTTFAHLLMMQHADLVPPPPSQDYVPKVYGFRINKTAKCIQARSERAEQQALKHQEQQERERREVQSKRSAQHTEPTSKDLSGGATRPGSEPSESVAKQK